MRLSPISQSQPSPLIASPAPMAPPPAYSGPYYVVLGGSLPGIYEWDRPANTAVGQHASLLPIVVTCSTLSDAEAVNKLNSEIFLVTSPTDAYRMMQLVQWEEGPLSKITLQTPGPYYAIRYGVETGIFIGFQWQRISHLVPAKKHVYKGFHDLAQALEFMLDKPGYNLPLLPAGAKLPPPDPPVASPTHDSASKTRRTPTSSRSSSPVKSTARAITSPSTPVATEKRAKVVISAPSLSTSSTPSRAKRPGQPQVSGTFGTHGSSQRASRPVYLDVETGLRCVEGQESDEHDGGSDDAASSLHEETDARLASGDQDTLEILRRVLRPAHNMPGGNRSLPITLGSAADALLTENGISQGEAFTVLQIYVHSKSQEHFTHYMGLALGWPTIDALTLWKAIKLPTASPAGGR
ncbi:hypothetical protein FKP32DRAFT_1677588 [Trametes sanguinea]|nr:hypothetical protein FKP32DRAFT_1677588 [Trametes sanguinea]